MESTELEKFIKTGVDITLFKRRVSNGSAGKIYYIDHPSENMTIVYYDEKQWYNDCGELGI